MNRIIIWNVCINSYMIECKDNDNDNNNNNNNNSNKNSISNKIKKNDVNVLLLEAFVHPTIDFLCFIIYSFINLTV